MLLKKNKLSKYLLNIILIGAISAVYSTFVYADIKPVIPQVFSSDLSNVNWNTIIPDAKKEFKIDSSSALNTSTIKSNIAGIVLPADRGTLDIKLTSIIEEGMVFIPNILVLDENMNPAALYASNHFKYEQAGILSDNRVEGKIKITPAIGQKQIYLLIYTTAEDLNNTTTMIAPAKAFAAGTGNAIPNIPDPIAQHSLNGRIIVEVASQNQSNDNIIVGLPIFNKDKNVTNIELPSTNQINRNVPASSQILDETSNYFDENIKSAVSKGDINKALQLLEEAERLGSKTARDVFVKSVNAK